ncbi:MAG TPA: hypothetical protein VN711_05240 [Candidatus Saccharimonadales bacterium]|nr:hypothetical protein [Candidatus Saccharimonadales bacterium]
MSTPDNKIGSDSGKEPPIAWAGNITPDGAIVLKPADPDVVRTLYQQREERTLRRGLQAPPRKNNRDKNR